MSKKFDALGIDIGGSGIKGAPVDLDKGVFTDDRLRVATPEESTPEAVCDVVEQIAEHFSVKTSVPLGITLPAVVTHGVVRTAANIDKSWIDTDARALFADRLGREVHIVNDADAAGVAERHHGAAKGVDGVVLVTTLGTGIGSALLVDGHLVPNTELGHLEIEGHDAESRAAESVRERDALTMEQWAERLQTYYSHLESLFWPDLIVVGGGVSKQAASFLPLLDLRTEIVPARLKNKAGIIGAARLAARGN
ncbi:ROK family protein [Janibacter sp. LM]|uniref:polyphosphate--glucose phosphotransferase n=1 Tax=Janibacter sp. LM TaxID=3144845 RepID=UPI0031F6D072